MELTGVAATALAIAEQRAKESERPDRLFEDPYARLVVAAGGEIDTSAFPRRDPSKAWIRYDGYFALRTRFFDDFLTAVDLGQVVSLAAGLDTRSLRLPLGPDVCYFEIDLPDLLRFKRRVLPSSPATMIAADLTGDWGAVLTEHGFRPDVPTTWLIEGLLMYLSAEQGRALLRSVTELSASGSRAGVETGGSALIREVGGELQRVPDGTGPRAWLTEFGWTVRTNPIAELGERYGRPVPPEFDPAGPRPDGLLVGEFGDPGAAGSAGR